MKLISYDVLVSLFIIVAALSVSWAITFWVVTP
jgi:hypothetical protein